MKNKIAIVQQPPVFMDLNKTIDKTTKIICEAKKNKADIVIFPEAYVPGYPAWMWKLRPGTDFEESQLLHRKLVENSVNLSKGGLKKLQKSAKENDITVAIGLNEIDSVSTGTTIYNSFAIIGPDGNILNVHRKLVPTTGERMIWGRGDASGLNVVNTPAGRIGGLICYENYMPLSRFTLYAQGIDLYLAPTWDFGEPWISTLRHIARESGCWVAGCAIPMQGKDIPKEFPFRDKIFPDKDEWLNNGDAVLIKPSGDIAVGPMNKKKGILYSEYDIKEVIDARRSLDVAGHYSRPDIFELNVKKSRLKQINFIS